MEPRIVSNSYSGERVIFGEYGIDESGTFLELVEVSLPAGAESTPEHRHLLGEERFEVIEGELGLRIEDREYVLEAGESITVPAGARHTWWNAGDTTVIGRGELRNPGRFEELLTTVFALVNSGATENGRLGRLQGAVTLAEYREEYDAVFLPQPIRWLALNVLAPVGRRLGYRAVHEYVPPARGHIVPEMPAQ